MRLVIERPHFCVFDEVLGRADWRRLRRYFAHEARLEFINRVDHLKVWSMDDGHPLFSPVVALELDARKKQKGALRAGDGPYFSYPSDSALDVIMQSVLDRLDALAPWVGRPGKAWRTLTARAFVYPQGTALDWHDDGGGYSGAFSYYAHQTWQAQWGGELLIAAGEKHTQMSGEFVLPMPNRLVVLKGGIPHKIARVSSSAGANHRLSVSGFFARAPIADVSEGTLVTDLV